jgi:hypothetical protein
VAFHLKIGKRPKTYSVETRCGFLGSSAATLERAEFFRWMQTPKLRLDLCKKCVSAAEKDVRGFRAGSHAQLSEGLAAKVKSLVGKK